VDAVILAGGQATRLRGVVDGPKCLVPIRGRPVLDHLIAYLRGAGARRITIAAGVQGATVAAHVRRHYAPDAVRVLVEPTALGTAGALHHWRADLPARFVVVNGDTLLEGSLAGLWAYHGQTGAAATLAVVRGSGAEFGRVAADAVPGWASAFLEKQPGPGWRSAGALVLERRLLDGWREVRSLERQVLPSLAAAGQLGVYPFWGMTDIGTPERLLAVEARS
jgi:NDP-sugar pyrophosphorylase family protein